MNSKQQMYAAVGLNLASIAAYIATLQACLLSMSLGPSKTGRFPLRIWVYMSCLQKMATCLKDKTFMKREEISLPFLKTTGQTQVTLRL